MAPNHIVVLKGSELPSHWLWLYMYQSYGFDFEDLGIKIGKIIVTFL